MADQRLRREEKVRDMGSYDRRTAEPKASPQGGPGATTKLALVAALGAMTVVGAVGVILYTNLRDATLTEEAPSQAVETTSMEEPADSTSDSADGEAGGGME